MKLEFGSRQPHPRADAVTHPVDIAYLSTIWKSKSILHCVANLHYASFVCSFVDTSPVFCNASGITSQNLPWTQLTFQFLKISPHFSTPNALHVPFLIACHRHISDSDLYLHPFSLGQGTVSGGQMMSIFLLWVLALRFESVEISLDAASAIL